MMNEWLDIIEYRDFHDVPRVFLVDVDGRAFLFDCPFDEEVDEYPDEYGVYEMPSKFLLERPADWTGLSRQAVSYKGKVSVRQITFDSTKRNRIDASVIRALLS